MVDPDWWKSFFDADYAALYKDRPSRDTEEELKTLEGWLGQGDGRLLLDACCGYGRHTWPLSRRGWRVAGFDYSLEMLRFALAAKPPPEEKPRHSPFWVNGDLRRSPFRENVFDAAINLFTSIGYFAHEAENFLLVQSIHWGLKEGGTFVLDVANRDFLTQFPNVIRNWWKAGNSYVLEETLFNPVASRAYTKNVILQGGRIRTSDYEVRLYSIHELVDLLESAGFKIEKALGNFPDEPLNVTSPRIIVLATKS